MLQKLRNKMRTEVCEFPMVRDAQKTENYAEKCITHTISVRNEKLDLLLDRPIGLFRNFKLIQAAREWLSAGLDVPIDLFYDESLKNKAVEGIQIFFKSDGYVRIVALGA